MSDLNESQRALAETLDGMVVVDAGPGTGKTHTIVERYVNLISREDVTPRNVMMLTFTRNAATEMEERIKNVMMERDMVKDSKLVQVKTFDAFCLSVVMDSPEEAGTLFGITEKLTHSARLVENETLNRTHFFRFLDWFLEDFGEDYGEWAIIAEKNRSDLYELIKRLMARGVYPMKGSKWFGGNCGRALQGDPDLLKDILKGMDIVVGKQSRLHDIVNSMDVETYGLIPAPLDDMTVGDDVIDIAVYEDRFEMLRFIHDTYWHYVRRSISEDRLTFGITSMLAFSILYSNDNVRKGHKYDYMMIDEFQDTNAGQLMMALMILEKPNLCVVGDWKQGIYGFRFVSIENILDFDNRVKDLIGQLNDDSVRVPFKAQQSVKLHLKSNYRSSESIVDTAFDCLMLRGSSGETVSYEEGSEPVRLVAEKQDDYGDDCCIRYIQCEDKVKEPAMVARAVRDYIGSGEYRIHTHDGIREARFGDIAVLCRTGATCRAVKEALDREGIPAFMQGDLEIMSTREGKLALAWLRYVNNDFDMWGIIPIMADMGYTMADCEAIRSGKEFVPTELVIQRRRLYEKRRRVTDLLTSLFGWYGLDNDITQAIINTLASAHRGSLLTLSDLISIIEDDIEAGPKSVYPVEMELDSDSVKIMTMHKSKGLEFPIVILPFIDQGIMPSTAGDSSAFIFDEVKGVRCTRRIHDISGYCDMYGSWEYELLKAATPKCYDEERRLMFVAMSRARQYETIICGPKPSEFMKGLSGGEYVPIPEHDITADCESRRYIDPPDVGGYLVRSPTMSVHELMDLVFEDGKGGMTEVEEVCGKGVEYGNQVHKEAENLFHGIPPSGRYPESTYILEEVLSRRKMDGFINSFSEIDCTLPVSNTGVTIRGTIDLLLVFEDHIEIHDYKTDVSDRFEGEYKLQLSVYAESARVFYKGLPVRCFIDYVSQSRTLEFDPLPMSTVEQRVMSRMNARCSNSDDESPEPNKY